MRNITDILARYLSDINLPSVSIIDIIEIILITFFVYQFMVWIKFTRAYTLLKGLLVIGAFLIIAYIFKMNTILWIVSKLASALITAIVVIFQPELRKVVEQLGQKKIMASIFPFDSGKEVKERFDIMNANSELKIEFNDKIYNQINRYAKEGEMSKVAGSFLFYSELFDRKFAK